MSSSENSNSNKSRDENTCDAVDPSELESHREWVLKWLDSFEQQLIQYATRLSRGQREIAVDAVQHTFLKLCDQSPEAIGDRLPGWLYRVCRNKVIDELRERGRDEEAMEHAADLVAQRETSPLDAAEAAEINAVLQRLMNRLTDAQREALDLWCRGFRYREIAEITGKSYGSIRVIVHRGLEQLRNHPRVKDWLEETTPSPRATLAD